MDGSLRLVPLSMARVLIDGYGNGYGYGYGYGYAGGGGDDTAPSSAVEQQPRVIGLG